MIAVGSLDSEPFPSGHGHDVPQAHRRRGRRGARALRRGLSAARAMQVAIDAFLAQLGVVPSTLAERTIAAYRDDLARLATFASAQGIDDATPTGRPLAWRKNDFLAYAVGQDEQAVSPRGKEPDGAPRLCRAISSIPARSSVHWIPTSRRMRISMPGAISSAIPCVAWLTKLSRRSCSFPRRTSLRIAGMQCRTRPAKVGTIGFPTGGDRVDLVERGLRSFAANAAQHQRKVDFVIADSSSKPEQRDAIRNAWPRLAGNSVLRSGIPARRSGAVCRRVNSTWCQCRCSRVCPLRPAGNWICLRSESQCLAARSSRQCIF